MKIVFWIITAIALLVSGNATYEVLTHTVGINTYIALAAAIVIDAAAIWMGHHTTVLARLGDNTRAAQLATWVIILISFCVNFFHGYTSGGVAGGFVGIIFPFLAALLYDFYIRHTIREVLRARGRILPEKPVVLKSRRYGDKARHVALQRDYVSLTYDLAEYKMRQLRDNTIQATRQAETSNTPVVIQAETNAPTRQYSETDVARQVETVFVDIETPEQLVALPDYLSPGMNTAEISRLLVENDVRDIDTAERYINIVNDDQVSRATVRQSMNRAIKKYETERESV